jgi:hypothetical protein
MLWSSCPRHAAKRQPRQWADDQLHENREMGAPTNASLTLAPRPMNRARDADKRREQAGKEEASHHFRTSFPCQWCAFLLYVPGQCPGGMAAGQTPNRKTPSKITSCCRTRTFCAFALPSRPAGVLRGETQPSHREQRWTGALWLSFARSGVARPHHARGGWPAGYRGN